MPFNDAEQKEDIRHELRTTRGRSMYRIDLDILEAFLLTINPR